MVPRNCVFPSIATLIRNLKTLFPLFFLVGCAYRFTNQHLNIPPQIKTIAFEAIYDTSRTVVPHDVLWEAFQRAFAKDGHLRVVSQGRADALLRIHLKSAEVRPSGRAEPIEPKKDKNRKRKPAPLPGDFRNLKQAGEHTNTSNVAFVLSVEIIDLYSRKVIFKRDYNGSSEFKSLVGASVVQEKTLFLLYEEALRTKYQQIANNMADEVVRDFTVGR